MRGKRLFAPTEQESNVDMSVWDSASQPPIFVRGFLTTLCFLLCLHIAQAQPIYEVTVQDTLESLQSQLGSKLPIRNQFDISGGLAGRGVDFMPYKLLLLEPDEAVMTALAEDPNLAVLLPPTLYLYSPTPEHTIVGVLDFGAVAEVFDLSEAARTGLKAHFDEVYAVLQTFGKLEHRTTAPAATPPFKTWQVTDLSAEDALLFLEATLATYNFNIVDKLELGAITQLHACNLTYGKSMLGPMPQLGVLAPCRIYLYESEGATMVGSLQASGLQALYPFNDALAATLRDILDELEAALSEVAGKP